MFLGSLKVYSRNISKLKNYTMGKRYKIIMLEIKAVLGLSTFYCIVIWLIAVFMNAKMINNRSSKKDYLKNFHQ